MAKPGYLWDENDIKIIAGKTKILLIAPVGIFFWANSN
jgi:hypothetical protein